MFNTINIYTTTPTTPVGENNGIRNSIQGQTSRRLGLCCKLQHRISINATNKTGSRALEKRTSRIRTRLGLPNSRATGGNLNAYRHEVPQVQLQVELQRQNENSNLPELQINSQTPVILFSNLISTSASADNLCYENKP